MRFFTTLLSVIIFALWLLIVAILITEDRTIEEPLLEPPSQESQVFKTNEQLFPSGTIRYEQADYCKAEL